MRAAVAAMAAFLFLPLIAGSASAQNEERYRLERTEDGYVRMDTETGEMTLCQELAGELVCRPATEGREGGQPEADLLRDRLAKLEKRVEALEQGRKADVPLEEEFEQSLNLMERFFRRFVDIVRGLEQEEQQQEKAPSDGAPPAERT